MTFNNLCNSCTNIGCGFQSGIVRTKCVFYMPPQLEPDNCGNYVVQDSTTKNDIRDNRVKNELNRIKDELEPTTKNDASENEDLVERIGKLIGYIDFLRNTAQGKKKSLNLLEKVVKGELKEIRAEGENFVKSRTGYISIDDVMSVFDDFMRGEADEEDTETFLEMLKDKAESEEA